MVVQKNEPTTLAIRHKQDPPSSHFNSSNRKPLHFSHCDRHHHKKETSWKLCDYPPKHPRHGVTQNAYSKPNENSQFSSNNVITTLMMQELQSTMNGLTELQLQQMLSIMHGNALSPSANPKVNNDNVPSGLSPPKLIIDSWATDHIISSPTLLVNSKENTSLPPVVIPNGNQAPIISIGTLTLSPIISLTNVLGVPSCKVDLMSVRRVTRDLNCLVTFFLPNVFYRI